MTELITIISKHIESLAEEEQKDVLKFSKRLESYIHVPVNEKEYKRMAVFATNSATVQVVLKSLSEYNYPKKYNHTFDIISYWYGLALLVQSENKEAKKFVLDLINNFLQSKHPDLSQFRRFLSFITHTKEFDTIKVTVENYFLSKQNELESYNWAKEIGLELPEDDKWYINFEISTDGKFRSGNSLSTKEKESRLILIVTAYPLRRENNCWEIELKNWNKSITAWWPIITERTIKLDNKWKNYKLKTTPSLRNLKNVIQEIEKVLNVKFERNIYLKTFSGKIKNKNAAQNWLKN